MSNKKDIEDDLMVQKVGADYRELWALAIRYSGLTPAVKATFSFVDFESQGNGERLLLCCGNIEQTFHSGLVVWATQIRLSTLV